jgi:hypothetical protein
MAGVIERRQRAQDMIMHAAFYALADDESLTEAEKGAMEKELHAQLNRVERLFGYEVGSWRA